MRKWSRWFCPAILTLLTAYGASNGLNVAQVQGHVSSNGEPVRYGDILFFVDESRGTQGPSAIEKISGDGTYVLSTETSGDEAIVRFHKAAITGLDPRPISAPAEWESASLSNSDAKKGLGAASAKANRSKGAVVARGSGLYRVVTPEKLSRPATSEINVEVKRGSNTINFAIQRDGSVKVE